MLQVLGADKHQVIVSDLFHTVPYNPLHACPVGHEIEFVFLVLVQGIGKLGLVPVDYVEAVLLRQGSDF